MMRHPQTTKLRLFVLLRSYILRIARHISHPYSDIYIYNVECTCVCLHRAKRTSDIM